MDRMEVCKMNKTYFLFSEPSFIEGIARIIDFGSTLNQYNDSISDFEADYRALKSDWQAVGIDMQEALEEYGKQKQT